MTILSAVLALVAVLLAPGEMLRLGGSELRHGGSIHTIRFFPDGKSVATASAYPDGRIRIWNAITGALMSNIESRSTGTEALALGPNLVAVVDNERVLKVFDLSGHLLWTRKRKCSISNVKSLTISPQGRRLAFGAGKDIQILDARNGQVLKNLRSHQRAVNGLHFGSDGLLLSTSWDKTLRLWDLDSERAPKVLTLPGYEMTMRAGISFDGHTFGVSGDSSGDLILLDATTLEVAARLEASAGVAFAFSPTRPELYTALYSQETQREYLAAVDLRTFRSRSLSSEPAWNAACIDVSPSGKTIGLASEVPTARIVGLEPGQVSVAASGHRLEANDVEFLSDGRVISLSRRELLIWDPRSNPKRPLKRLSHGGDQLAIAGDHIVVFGLYRKPLMLRSKDQKIEGRLPMEANIGDCMALSPSGKRMAVSTDQKGVRLFSTRTKKRILSLSKPEQVDALTFLGEEQLYISGDFGLMLVDIPTKKPKKTWPGIEQIEHMLVLDSKHIAVAHGPKDDAVEIIHRNRTRPAKTLRGDWVNAMARWGKNKLVLAGHQVRIWDWSSSANPVTLFSDPHVIANGVSVRGSQVAVSLSDGTILVLTPASD